MFNAFWGRIFVSLERICFKVFVDYISFSFYVKYIWKKCDKNFFGCIFWAPYRSNGIKIHLDAALT